MLAIEVYCSGALGKDLSKQSQMILDGVADIGYAIPAMTPDRFVDNAVIALPSTAMSGRRRWFSVDGLRRKSCGVTTTSW
jgi:hypothetical protein